MMSAVKLVPGSKSTDVKLVELAEKRR